MDKSRKQFEEEFKKRVELPTSDIFKINDDTGEYYYMTPRQAWYWWQASRESLDVELPDKYTLEYMQDDLSDSECDFFKCDDIKNELLSNGVKIKNG
ncbi:hypothetical protein ACW2AL_13075 [Providencia sp. PROV170]|nr:hypothetical protein [Providencia rettgeri]ELR5051898.1 hypothetical protein [Providencia rettgeri]ELR5157386.1 hypothetical protein [Providencia rettgeri]ELR5184306.1 hypothetical protein [Providencia rettgeri]ELR5276802.1 hypothetical protein [Providencia rettgeri]